MKKILMLFIILFALSACAREDNEIICNDGELLINDICTKENVVANRSNPLNINTGNLEGWSLFMNYDKGSTLDISDGVITFQQSGESDSSPWSRKMLYDSLNVEKDFIYELSFWVKGTKDESFNIQYLSDDLTVLGDEVYTLSGEDQKIVFELNNTSQSTTGILVFGFGSFNNNSSAVISGFEYHQKSRSDEEMNILFIGNSFTFYNEMPKMLQQMAIDNNHNVNVEMIAYGGYSLSNYISVGTDATKEVLDKLNEKDWDYVILQEHSRKPDTNKIEFLNSVKSLNDLITSKGAKTILYSTWSYRDGTDKLDSTGQTYEEFYNTITNAYLEAGTANDIIVAPVGSVFYDISVDSNPINLIRSDDFHPNNAGSYVAAYTFYTMIFGMENNNLYIPLNVSSEEAARIREFVINRVE